MRQVVADIVDGGIVVLVVEPLCVCLNLPIHDVGDADRVFEPDHVGVLVRDHGGAVVGVFAGEDVAGIAGEIVAGV